MLSKLAVNVPLKSFWCLGCPGSSWMLAVWILRPCQRDKYVPELIIEFQKAFTFAQDCLKNVQLSWVAHFWSCKQSPTHESICSSNKQDCILLWFYAVSSRYRSVVRRRASELILYSQTNSHKRKAATAARTRRPTRTPITTPVFRFDGIFSLLVKKSTRSCCPFRPWSGKRGKERRGYNMSQQICSKHIVFMRVKFKQLGFHFWVPGRD